jgi:hypothetical protein
MIARVYNVAVGYGSFVRIRMGVAIVNGVVVVGGGIVVVVSSDDAFGMVFAVILVVGIHSRVFNTVENLLGIVDSI